MAALEEMQGFRTARRGALEMQINTAGAKSGQCTRVSLPGGAIGLIPSVPHPKLCLLAQREFAQLKAQPIVRISDCNRNWLSCKGNQ